MGANSSISPATLFANFSISSIQIKTYSVPKNQVFYNSKIGFFQNVPDSAVHIGSGTPLSFCLLKVHGYSDLLPLQEWGDNSLIWLRFFRTSVNKLKFVTSNYGGLPLDFEGVYNFANQLGIGNITPHSSAILDIASTNKGVLLPRMTTSQINAISTPAEGLEVYNTTLKKKCFFNGTAWQQLTSTTM
jgi:hypothetical protein